MKKSWIIGLSIALIILLGIGIGVWIFQNTGNKKQEQNSQIAQRDVEDECTEDQRLYEMGLLDNLENSEEASSSDEKISPNAKILIKKHYSGCGHTTKDYAEIPSEIVNFTKEELQEYYKDWNIQTFSKDEIVIEKECEGSCDEHYIVKELDGFVAVFNIDEKGQENLVLKTDVATTYLPQTDLENLKSGIKVIGKDELNKVLEDFE